ncbi:MAG: glucosaminidase domain-containing protein [Bacteroidaceae bacterium]|nr:glucosaminidase domain-containing protein [Bacteroidaceae bacterium]
MNRLSSLSLILTILLVSCSTAKHSTSSCYQQRNYTYEQYIERFYPIAVEQMQRHGIPASITLAQGLLESGAGNSSLTRKSNNHFGIKADSSWKGKRTTSRDNGKNCYFRVYDNPRESYEDHSKFLVGRERYASLFKLNKKDYKGWAKGLKKAGYAEDPGYPNKLISLIERYELYKYDNYSKKDIAGTSSLAYSYSGTRQIYLSSGLPYIIADTGDTFKSLSKETGVSRRKLIKYNDLYKEYEIKAGDIIYLDKKNNKAQKPHKFHTTTEGESLYSISQKYGIKLKKLLDMNPQFKSYAKLKVGDILILR